MLDFPSKIYDLFMKPLEKKALSQIRKSLIPKCSGHVLEIGPGTGANFPFYPFDQLSELTLLDLSFSKKVMHYPFLKELPVHYVEGSVENLPFPDNTFDTAVFTLVFCSVPNPLKGLSEIYRVLKPGGRIYFLEHVLSSDPAYSKMMHALNPIWKNMAHGCHLNRDTLGNIQNSNFKMIEHTQFWKDIFIAGVAEK